VIKSKNYKRLSLILILVLVSSIGFTDPHNTDDYPIASEPEHSPFRLRNDLTDSEVFIPVDKIFKSFLRRWEIAGASVSIAKDGKLVFARGYGKADRENEIETQPFHLFRVASISKLITAVTIMSLEEEGRLDLDQKVFGVNGILNDSIYLYPRDKRVFDITIRHLLTHSGGWTRRWGDHMFIPHAIAKFMEVPSPPDTETIVQFALAKKLHYTPGSYRVYSNLGYREICLLKKHYWRLNIMNQVVQSWLNRFMILMKWFQNRMVEMILRHWEPLEAG